MAQRSAGTQPTLPSVSGSQSSSPSPPRRRHCPTPHRWNLRRRTWLSGFVVEDQSVSPLTPSHREHCKTSDYLLTHTHTLCPGCLQIWQNEIRRVFQVSPDPLNSLFHTIIKLKPDVMNRRSSHFGTFLVELQNIFLRSMMTGSTHASHRVTAVAVQTYMSA